MIDIRKEVAKILDEACKCAKNRFKTKVSIYDFGCVSRWELDEDDAKNFGYLKTEEYYFRVRGCPGWLFAIDACLVNEDRLDITACYGTRTPLTNSEQVTVFIKRRKMRTLPAKNPLMAFVISPGS